MVYKSSATGQLRREIPSVLHLQKWFEKLQAGPKEDIKLRVTPKTGIQNRFRNEIIEILTSK